MLMAPAQTCSRQGVFGDKVRRRRVQTSRRSGPGSGASPETWLLRASSRPVPRPWVRELTGTPNTQAARSTFTGSLYTRFCLRSLQLRAARLRNATRSGSRGDQGYGCA